MNKNKKYLVLIVLVLIPHITSTKKEDPTELNYSIEQIRKDYGESLPLFLKSKRACKSVDIIPHVSLAIEDKKENDHVKITVRGITSNVASLEVGNDDVFTTKTNNETIRVAYDNQVHFLSVDVFVQHKEVEKQEQEGQVKVLYYKDSQENSIGKKLQSAIEPYQSKTDYDEEEQTLTIVIPRVNGKQEGRQEQEGQV